MLQATYNDQQSFFEMVILQNTKRDVQKFTEEEIQSLTRLEVEKNVFASSLLIIMKVQCSPYEDDKMAKLF